MRCHASEAASWTGGRCGRFRSLHGRTQMRSRAGALGALGATFLALAGVLGCSSSSTQTGGASGAKGSAGSSSGTVAAACNLPLTQDIYDGFHIGVPPGWNLFRLNGTIVVAKDPTEQSTVTPVLMTAGLTPAKVFSSSLSSLQNQITATGGSMTYTINGSTSEHPTADLTLRAGQATLTGEAREVVLPQPTAHGGSIAALLASWAPTSSFAVERSTLAGIGTCYGPQPGTLYQVMKDQVFTFAIPPGWTVQSEGQDTIEIAKGNDASATYTLTLLPPGTGVNSPQSLLSYAFGKLGIHVDQVLNSQETPTTQVGNGGSQAQGNMEFTGSLGDGRAVHGLANVVAATGGPTPSGVIRLALATTSLWNSVNGALVHIVNSIQHSSVQDLQQWENLNRQQQAFSEQVQGFDYALNGVDLVHDPSTGATFEAPYDTYRASGPDGPGYYDQANNKLQIETP